MSQANGHAPTSNGQHVGPHPSAANVASNLSLAERKTELEVKILESQLRVIESVMNDDYAFGGSDLLDELRRQTVDADGTRWAPSNIPSDRRGGANWPIWRTERELGDLRQKSRVITQANSYAGGLLRNLTSHVIGKGGTYKAKPRKDVTAPTLEGGQLADLDALAKDVQEFIDDHNKKNRWNCGNDPRMGYQAGPTREQEIFRRVFRDGESILRAFLLTGDEGNPDNKGRTFWRFVEPACVKNGPGCLQIDGWFLGMKHRVEPYEDVEDVQKYWCEYLDKSLGNQEQRDEPQGEEVDAAHIVHAKNPDEDAMIGRGTPFFAFDTFDAFYRAGRLQRAISIGATLRACRAEMWEHQVATQAQISNLAAGRGIPVQNRDTGKNETTQRMKPGQIVDGPASRKLVQPVQGQVNENLDACQGDLRQAASAACAPEYMVSADASNANYASTKESGTPFVSWAELLQEHFKAVFLACIWKAVRWAVEQGILPKEVMDLIEITVELPKVAKRDPLQSAQEDQILVQAQIKDPQTCSAERGLDPDDVEQNILERQESMGMSAGGPAGGFGGLPPAGGGSPFGEQAGGGQVDAEPAPAMPHAVTESLADVTRRLVLLESKDASGHEHDDKTGQFGKGSFVPKHQGGEGFAKKADGGEHSQNDLDDMGKGELIDVAKKHGIEDTAGLGSAALRAHLKSLLHEDQNPPAPKPQGEPVDAKTVAHHVAIVKQLWTEAGDVKNFPAAKIQAAMAELGKLPVGELSEIANGFGIDKPEKSRPKIVQQIEKKITATYRAHVGNRV